MFGDKLKKLRRDASKTQQEVAKEISSLYSDFEMSQANISHLENRETAPREEILDVLAGYFGVSKTYFLDSQFDSYEQRKPQIESYLLSLDSRIVSDDEIRLHTEENSSGDKETLDTLDNLRKWYDSQDYSEEF